MELRRLEHCDLDACYANRLRALEHAPEAFLTTLAEERARGTAFLDELLARGDDQNLIFGALSEGCVVGTVGIYRHEKLKSRHTATIWGMYVDIDQRGAGLGGRLLELAIEHARARMGATVITLDVEADNAEAKRLYESRGFRSWGLEEQAMCANGVYYAVFHMALDLR